MAIAGLEPEGTDPANACRSTRPRSPHFLEAESAHQSFARREPLNSKLPITTARPSDEEPVARTYCVLSHVGLGESPARVSATARAELDFAKLGCVRGKIRPMALTNLRLVVKHVDGSRLGQRLVHGSTLSIPEFPVDLTWRTSVTYDLIPHATLTFVAQVEAPDGSIVAESWAGAINLEHSEGTDVPLEDFTVSEPGRYTVRATVDGKSLPPQTITIKRRDTP